MEKDTCETTDEMPLELKEENNVAAAAGVVVVLNDGDGDGDDCNGDVAAAVDIDDNVSDNNCDSAGTDGVLVIVIDEPIDFLSKRWDKFVAAKLCDFK